MCKEGLVYGVATDDMDALTFGTPKLIRHLMAPGNNQKLTIDEFDYETMLQQMDVTPVCPVVWQQTFRAVTISGAA